MSRAAIKLLVTPQLHQSDKDTGYPLISSSLSAPDCTQNLYARPHTAPGELPVLFRRQNSGLLFWMPFNRDFFFCVLQGKDFISLHSFKLVICICQAKD